MWPKIASRVVWTDSGRPSRRSSKRALRPWPLDMWDPYVASVRGHLPKAEEKMVFDKFHIAKHLGEAVDRVRRREHKGLKAEGDERLKGTEYDGLRNPASLEGEQKREFAELRKSELQTARAWAL